jgi:hypothetical protein
LLINLIKCTDATSNPLTTDRCLNNPSPAH